MMNSNQGASYLDDPDVQLMLAFQKGDVASFEKLMVKYFKPLLNFIYRMIGNRETAEEITQEVFIRVYKSAFLYEPRSKFRTWAYTIARNLSLNSIRDKKKNTHSLDESFESEDGVMSRQVEDVTVEKPDEALLLKEKNAVIMDAIHSLPENQRTAVLLCRFEGLSYEDISKTMGTSVEAVKSLLSRAKENLKIRLRGLVE